MMEGTKRKALKWGSLLPGVFLIGALMAENVPAQEKQRQESRQQKQQQSQATAMNRGQFTDDMLEDLLVIRLAERSNLTQTIKVNVKEGVATISGKVPDETAKRRALRIVNSTKGISSVRDQINIDPSLTRAVSAKELKVNEKELVKQVAQKIAASIEGAKAGQDWWFEGWRVEGEYNRWNLVVEVDEPGFVVLEGEVPSLDIMRKAVEAAAQVPGVRALDVDMELDQNYAYRYPYYGFGYPYYRGFYGYPFAYGYGAYAPYAFAPHAFYPPATPAQDERQATSRMEGQPERR